MNAYSTAVPGLGRFSRTSAEIRQAALEGGPDSLGFWILHYMRDAVVGRSPNTFEAKARDLSAFAVWLQKRGLCDIRAWRVSDTRLYLSYLLGEGRAPTTVNRALGSLKHFARWVQDRHAVFGNMGLPTAGVRSLPEEESECRKLSDAELQAVFAAGIEAVRQRDAQIQTVAPSVGNQRSTPASRARPRRNLAMLALLYYTGLCAQELVVLRLDQYDGENLRHVARKGQNQSRRVYVPLAARHFIGD